MIGSIGIVIPLIGIFSGEATTKGIGYSMGAAIFLILGILLYIKTGTMKTINDKTKSKQLVCPNGCNITQAGSKFCGQCGAKLVWK
jgi:uncharacterized membrane protein YiaA